MKNNKYIYLCGPTVYNKVHIGNMRPIVTFDLMLRGLKYKDSNIKLIHNITDIDDKIINKAKQENVSEEKISKTYTEFYLSMLSKYNIQTIDFMPKVSKKIAMIDQFINNLKNKDFVYESNGSFYFKTSKLSTYGEVSHNLLENLQSDDNNTDKENPFDFALWKNKTEGKTWNTSLGNGRPGWHTECAAFINELTKNESLLIHGGGIDLKFPHHENENAQFRALTNNPICEEWIHVGIINFKNQKMSKSIGNLILADEFLDKYESQTNAADLFRLMIISSSIKSTIELSDEMIDSLIKKNIQIEKIINYVLINNFENKKYIINNEFVDNLAQGKFSNIYKNINEDIKNFNSSKKDEYAISLYNKINFLGFNMSNNKISEEDKQNYSKWIELVKNKQYDEADKYRKILLDKKLI